MDRRMLTPLRLGIAVVALIVVAAVVAVAIVQSTDTEATTEPAPATPTPPATPSGPAPSAGETYESACGLRGGSLQEPTQEPADLRWERLDGWAYPISDSAGPGRRSPSGPWSCFARTPTGAVIAAHTIGLRLGLAADFDAVARSQTMPGVGQKALLQEGPTDAAGSVTDTKGFVIEAYTNDQAVISYYLVDQGQSFTCSAEVRWYDGDWRLALQPDGSTGSGCVDSAPTRYVAWGDR